MPEDLQFDRAESSDGADKTATCSICQRPMTGSYFAAGERTFCPDCKARIETELRTNRGNLPRAILFGVAGAFAGALLYFGVTVITGYEIGLIAIAVGWLVGRAMQKGSGGHGGRVFQIVAVVLTYLSISGAYFGMVLKEVVSSRSVAAEDAGRSDSLGAPGQAESPAAGATAPGPDSTSGASEAESSGASSRPWMGLVFLAVGLPIVSALQSMPAGLLGLLIIFIGLHQAWRMNQRPEIAFLGPFQIRPGGPMSDPGSPPA